ncbi:MAG: hypothetical protein KAI24_24780 [Planctomycetes bacterium]|nr:hypothetical protein [Planctomycetota bacterium]
MSRAQHTFSFTFDRPFVRRALRRDRNWAVVKVVALYALATPAALFGVDGLEPLVYGLLGGGFVATLALALALFHKAGNAVYDLWLRQSPSRTIRYELDDDGFAIHMDHASSRFAWRGLRRLWRYPDVWLIEVVRKQSAFFPPEGAGAEALAFIEQRCSQAGVRT